MLRTCILNFAKLLASHDWTYQYSDDMSYYKAGAKQWDDIKVFMKNHEPIRPVLQAMLDTANPFKNGEFSN